MLRTACILMSICSVIAAMAQQYGFTRFAPKDGLAQSQVRCMAQDARGHMWFGTIGGASRFDGLQWENYGAREGLLEPQVNAIMPEPGGAVWLAAGNGLYHWMAGRITRIDLPPGLSQGRFTDLALGPDGDLLIATEGAGVWRRRAGRLEPLPGYPLDTAAHARKLLLTTEGTLYIGLRNGLLTWKANGYHAVPLDLEEPPSVSALAQGADGTVWVGTFGDGLFALRTDGRQNHLTTINGLLQDHVRDLLVDRQGLVWVCTKFGLNRIQHERVRSFTVHQGLPNDNAWCIHEDDEGHIWIGTDGGGVLRFPGEDFVTLTTREGLCNDLVMSIVSDKEDALWLGTYGSGICRQDAMAMITTTDGLPNNTIWCGLRDKHGQLWFGTSDGPCRIVNGKLLPLVDPGDAMGVRILSMYEDTARGIWLGARDGAYLLDHDGRLVRHHRSEDGAGRSIRCIRPGPDGALWFACEDGIRVLRGERLTRLKTGNEAGEEINTLAWDADGRLWMGTSRGLMCYSNGQMRSFPLGSDPGSQIIGLLQPDAQGRLWVGTNNGLFRFHPGPLHIGAEAAERFTDADGLLSTEFNLNATFMDARGRLFFGSAGGLLMHDPGRTDIGTSRHHAPIVHITGSRSFLRATDWSGQCDSVDRSTGLPVGLTLPYRRHHLTFDFSAVDLGHPERVRYRYRLVGSDEDWLPPTEARFASYAYLPQGTYTFEVMATVDGNIWSAPDRATFRVLPPFWFTWWFFTLVAVLITGVAFTVHRFRRAQRERHERTRQLMLRSRMLRLEQQALNSHMNRHFVFNALNSIQYYINRQDRDAANRYLTSFARLIRRNLDASQNDTTTLAEELERLGLYLELEHMRFKDKFRYEVIVEPGSHIDQVRIPAMMLQPYVENSIWHGILPLQRQGCVEVRVRPMGSGGVRISVVDDGIGLNASLNKRNGVSGDHISRGIEITKGRVDVMRTLALADIRIEGPVEVIGDDGMIQGTRVVIDILSNGTSPDRPEHLQKGHSEPIFVT